jgi:CheY-like chemotaxis protein
MKKVIFIDDNPLDQFILKRILTKYQLSYEVNCTDNGEEVLEFLEQNKWDKNNLPDIILLDIYMPRFNGWEFLERVQDLYPTLVKPLKIYILSSSINPADITYSRQYSCVKSFLFKPITKEVLEHVIKEEISDAI